MKRLLSMLVVLALGLGLSLGCVSCKKTEEKPAGERPAKKAPAGSEKKEPAAPGVSEKKEPASKDAGSESKEASPTGSGSK